MIIRSTIPQVVRYAVYESSFLWTKNGEAIGLLEGHMQLRRSNGDLGPHNILCKDAKIVIIDLKRSVGFRSIGTLRSILGHMLFVVILNRLVEDILKR